MEPIDELNEVQLCKEICRRKNCAPAFRILNAERAYYMLMGMLARSEDATVSIKRGPACYHVKTQSAHRGEGIARDLDMAIARAELDFLRAEDMIMSFWD